MIFCVLLHIVLTDRVNLRTHVVVQRTRSRFTSYSLLLSPFSRFFLEPPIIATNESVLRKTPLGCLAKIYISKKQVELNELRQTVPLKMTNLFYLLFFSFLCFFFSGTHVRTVRTSGYPPIIIGDAVQCKMFMKFMNLCQISFLLNWTMQNLEQKKRGFNNIPIILTYSAFTVTVPRRQS